MSYVSEVLADNPAFYYRLNDSSGLVALDSSPNARNGTLTATGITYSQTGAIPGDNALLFDGATGAMQRAFNLSAISIVTVECWAKFAGFNNTDDLLCEYTANSNTNNGFYIDPCTADGTFSTQIRSSATNNVSFVRPSTGVFHHFVFVFKAGVQNNAIIPYLDGSSWSGTRTETGTSNTPFQNQNFNFMSRNQASLFLNATLDEVAVYPAELSSARVAAHYAAAFDTSVPNLAPVIYGRGAC